MSIARVNKRASFFGSPFYVLLALVASIPIWLITDAYGNATGVHLDEAMSTASTICCLAGIFAGRYIAAMWTGSLTVMPVRLLTYMAVIVVVFCGWLFFFPPFDYMVPGVIRLLLYWLPFTTGCLLTGAAIKIVSAVNRNKVKFAETAAEISKSELQLLQSKLSPHFLFNTLNNMYGISITLSEKIPELLLKLSDLLRYSVYDAGEIFVPLKDEIAYIHNYIDFEKIRIGKKLELTIDMVETIDTSIKIAPLLLIIFIENAFKHAKNTADKKIFIDIQLRINGDFIKLFIRNSQYRSPEIKNITNAKSGFGLTSAKRRLELLYPGEHELEIRDELTNYQVDLQLIIK